MNDQQQLRRHKPAHPTSHQSKPRDRKTPESRREELLQAAAECAHQGFSYREITQQDIAKQAGVTPALITYHFVSMENLRHELMMWAIRNNDLQILAQGLVVHDTQALAAPDTAKANALAALASVK